MIKKLLYTLSVLALVLTACTQDETPGTAEAFGTLALDGIRPAKAEVTNVNTRAVSEGLYVEILQGDSLIHRYEPGQAPESVKLPVGTYAVRAYNEAGRPGAQQPTDGLGSPRYYAETTIGITEGVTQTLRLEVPMLNLGVRFALDEAIAGWFQQEQTVLTIQLGGVEKQLHPGETAYFEQGETPATEFTYTLVAVNLDGESFDEPAATYRPTDGGALPTGTVYAVEYCVNDGLKVSNN